MSEGTKMLPWIWSREGTVDEKFNDTVNKEITIRIRFL